MRLLGAVRPQVGDTLPPMKLRTLTLGLALSVVPAVLAAQSTPSVGDLAPELSLVGTDGSDYVLSETMEGPRVVIFFRGTW